MALVELRKINKNFRVGNTVTEVHNDLDLSINEGELIAVMGKSGCGKTTLLNIIAGVDSPDSGEYLFDGKPVVIKKTNDGVKFRRNQVGMIFQHFALINEHTVYENIELGLWESKLSREERMKRVLETLEKLAILDLKDQYPDKLSGGEKQRVAIGRAIVGKPRLILADEPTGSLDAETEKSIIKILKNINKQFKTTMAIVTHDDEVAKNCDRTIVLVKH